MSLLRRNKKKKETVATAIDKDAGISELMELFAKEANDNPIEDMIEESKPRVQRTGSRVKVRRMRIGSALGKRNPS